MANGRIGSKSKELVWRQRVREQRQSGISIREFCRKHKLTETAFYFWRRELERRGAADLDAVTGRAMARRRRRQRTTFLPVRIESEAAERTAAAGRTPHGTGRRIEIVLAGSRQVHVLPPVDRRALADVLAVLEGRAC
jgi:hypothetical protein